MNNYGGHTLKSSHTTVEIIFKKHLTNPSKRLILYTSDIGHPKLAEHPAGVIALMCASANWNSFYRLFQRAYTKYDATRQLPFDDIE